MLQEGLLPPLRSSDASLFTRSERIIQDYAKGGKLNAAAIKKLIQEVLHHPEFNADEVDHNMHERLMTAVEDGDVEVLDMHVDGDGDQDMRFFKRKVESVLRTGTGEGDGSLAVMPMDLSPFRWGRYRLDLIMCQFQLFFMLTLPSSSGASRSARFTVSSIRNYILFHMRFNI